MPLFSKKDPFLRSGKQRQEIKKLKLENQKLKIQNQGKAGVAAVIGDTIKSLGTSLASARITKNLAGGTTDYQTLKTLNAAIKMQGEGGNEGVSQNKSTTEVGGGSGSALN